MDFVIAHICCHLCCSWPMLVPGGQKAGTEDKLVTGGVAAGVSLSSEDLASLGGMSFQDPFSSGAGSACDDASSFIALTSCSWEQDVSCLKVYIPLRGVHDDMIRTHFTRHSVEVTHPCDSYLSQSAQALPALCSMDIDLICLQLTS